jgi:glycosyltransferase involved in cell wall biosynthesis
MLIYSIIIPHRNSPELLLKAVFSVPKRGDLEILVVDNSSYDAIGPIKEKLMSHGNVVLLYSGIAKGAGHARNVGLEHASGKWLLFLDADDFYLPKAFEEIDHWKDTVHDIVYFTSKSIELDTGEDGERHLFNNSFISGFINGREDAENILRYSYLPPWGKLIRRSLVQFHNITFDEVLKSEDVLFSMHTGHWATSVQCSQNPVYCVTNSSGSLVKNRNQIPRRHAFLMTIKGMCFLKSVGKSQYHVYNNQLLPMIRDSKDLGVKELTRWFFIIVSYRWNMMPEVFAYLKRLLERFKRRLFHNGPN